MGKLWMPVSNFKKIKEDERSATLRHPDGHEVTLAKNILSPHMKQQLAALPLHGAPMRGQQQQAMARGGRVQRFDDGGEAEPDPQPGPSPVQQELDKPGIQPPSGQPSLTQQMGNQPPQQGQMPSQGQNVPVGPSPGSIDYNSQGIKGIAGGRSPYQLVQKGLNAGMTGAQQGMNAGVAAGGMRVQGGKQTVRDLNQDLDWFHKGIPQNPADPNSPRKMGYDALMDETGKVKADYMSGAINPNHFIESGALPKIMTAVGLLGSMANSRGGGKNILDFVNSQMERDVQSQMFDKNKQLNVINANLHLMGNMQDALTLTRAQRMAVQSAIFEQAAGMAQSGEAKQMYGQLAQKYYMDMAQMVSKFQSDKVTNSPVQIGGIPGGAGNPQNASGQQMTDSAGNPQGSGAGGVPYSPQYINQVQQKAKAQAADQGPMDAGGNPLPKGQMINPSAYKDSFPVKLPGGGNSGFAFANDDGSQKIAQGAVLKHAQLDRSIQGVKDAWKTGTPLNPGGADWSQKSRALSDLALQIRSLAPDGKLTEQQQKSLKDLSDIASNPGMESPFEGGKGKALIDQLAKMNTDTLHSTLSTTLRNYPGNIHSGSYAK